ncbi:MAG: hypothetical protein AMXMBFR53_02570 [Gemmatimonadota bacterium]
MVARLKSFLPSLGIRLLVPLYLSVGVVLAVHAYVSFRSTKDHFLSLVGGEAHRSSGLIRRATHDGMLLNRLDDVQATIERMAEGPEVAVIRVYSREGTIVLSSDRGEIGRQVPLGATPCAACHGKDDLRSPPSTEAAEVIQDGAEEVLRQLSVIENEPGCSVGSCHAADAGQSVLGVLDVEMSMLPAEAALDAASLQLLWTTLSLLAVVALVSAVIFHRFIRQPIARLQAGARRIAGGDLSTRIEVTGGHELAHLADDFNRMAEDLSRAQQEVEVWSSTLEEKVDQRTEELRRAQHQVQHMEKMASLGKLSATVAHELNNPISGILTYARLVERELDDQPLEGPVKEEMGRYLSVVKQESARCGSIVRNLLLFARMDGGQMATVDLNQVVDRSLMLIRHHMEITGVLLETQRLEGNATLFANGDELQQAMVALLVNAVEAMPDGGRLWVALEGDGDEVRVEVTDTGTGIPADALPHIFEPFFSTKTKESGVGLGLAVVYGIVHRHGGRITVDSTLGEGTSFHIVLPRNPLGGREAAGADPAEAEHAGTTGSQAG